MSVTVLSPGTHELRPPEKVNLTDSPRDHLSHTALSTFLACQQRFAFHYEHRLSPSVAAEPLALGRAFAHALELSSPELGEKQLREQAAQEAERAAGNPWLVAPSQDEVDIQATIVREASRAYINRYGTHAQTREVELRARVRNPAVGGRYSLTHDVMCRVDAVSTDWATLYEDKLVGQIPRRSLSARLALDRQVSLQTYLIWRATGVEVSEVRYRMTLKPAIRRRKDESHEDYLARIGEEYATRPDHYLTEEIAHRTRDDYLRLEQELWEWAEQIRRARRTGVWPRNTGACHDHGGCRFLALCAQEPGAEHQFVTREERPNQEAA